MEQQGYRLCIINHSKQTDHVEYLIRLVSMEDNSLSIQFLERYSNLKTLHDNLRKETMSTSFPRFPPKKFFGTTDEKFLNQRQTELNSYFDSIFNSKEFSQLPSLKKWIDEALKKYSSQQSVMPNNKPQPENANQIISSPPVSVPENVEKPSSRKNTFNDDENQKLREMIEQCAKQLIDMGSIGENDFQADLDKEREYQKIVKEKGVFIKALCDSSPLFMIDAGKDENCDMIKDDKIKENLNKCENVTNKIMEYSSTIWKNITEIYTSIEITGPI